MTTPGPPDERVNTEAIPEDQPNAASPLPDHGERRPAPTMGRIWGTLVVLIGILLGFALVWSLFAHAR